MTGAMCLRVKFHRATRPPFTKKAETPWIERVTDIKTSHPFAAATLTPRINREGFLTNLLGRVRSTRLLLVMTNTEAVAVVSSRAGGNDY